jgi:hypothetical protein
VVYAIVGRLMAGGQGGVQTDRWADKRNDDRPTDELIDKWTD